MRLDPTTEKILIKWFVYANEQKIRYTGGAGFIAWDASCSCGWESKTGGAIRASVLRDVLAHKRFDHNYMWGVGA
jgi:hypothetical protein